ncbi:probable signal peptidase complex subunit 1 isoform X1 [Juglans regia]|nr:probable signal peptidase complex subunit 1 isoform X1 [Juglans regia]
MTQLMDWQGQKLAEELMQIMLLAFAVISFATGYIYGSFQMMVLIYAGGVVLTTLLTAPNWPLFNRHPLKWLESSESEKHPKPQQAVSFKKKPAK